MSQPEQSRADWQLPAGVSRSLWEFAGDASIARDEDRHLADAPLLAFDGQVVERWLPATGRAIDLGCGTGRMAIELAARGWSVVGVDLSDESLQVASERAVARHVELSLLRGNLCDLGFLTDSQFDAALLLFGTLGMISGADHRLEVLRHVQRLLRPGGRLVMHVHSLWRHLYLPQGRAWLVRDGWRRLTGDPAAGDTYHDYRGIPQMYHHAFTRAEWRRLLREAGLRVREEIPLAPAVDTTEPRPPGPDDPVCRGLWKNLRATGWMILADRP